MYWRHEATLIATTTTKDAEGYKTTAETRREVLVNKKSATRSEFYAARQSGDKIVLVLEVRGVDYEDETSLEFEGKPYEVVRAYTSSGEIYELNCKEGAEPPKPAQDDAGEEAGA